MSADEAGYFAGLAAALHAAGIGEPALVVDRARLLANVAAARRSADAAGLAVRVVVKSLPAKRLIDEVASALDTRRFMVFNRPMLVEAARLWPDGDFLLGKPLSAAAAAAAMDELPADVSPQWLVDSPERLRSYAEIAAARGRRLRANLEIDVGMHRGGLAGADAVAALLDVADALGNSVEISGLMGYEPHVVKMPDRGAAFARAVAAFTAARDLLAARRPGAALTLNMAGSPTYTLHGADSPANEVSIGSSFVQPAGFDDPGLAAHVPAAFIATPALKVLRRADGPRALFALMGEAAQAAVFIHGGNWQATPVHPPGLAYSPAYGRSSNQELLVASGAAPAIDDFVFLRPVQSEAVFLQFGDILVYDGVSVAGRWSTFAVSA